jgi:hypothetical protein
VGWGGVDEAVDATPTTSSLRGDTTRQGEEIKMKNDKGFLSSKILIVCQADRSTFHCCERRNKPKMFGRKMKKSKEIQAPSSTKCTFDDEFKSDLDGHNDIFFSQRVMGHSVNHVSGIADSQKASKNNVFG